MPVQDVAYWGKVKRMAVRLYLASYPVGTEVKTIEPLSFRPDWERAMWQRVAIAAINAQEGYDND